MTTDEGKMVLVTTEFRGVFCGELIEDKSPDEVTLKNARNCIYWHRSIGGFGGLATVGPNEECKIGAMVDRQRLFKITSISHVSESAAQRWRETETCQ